MENLIRDIKHGVRSLLRDKGFAATVVLLWAFALRRTPPRSRLSIRSYCAHCRVQTPTRSC